MLDYLRKKFNDGDAVDTKNKMQFAAEIACGMDHLNAEKFIHRDLASRNVLLASGKSHTGLVCKVADFGLSRGTSNDAENAASEHYYRSSAGVFPVRWTSPEAMETLKFTWASDVWSFGIVVVEMCVAFLPSPSSSSPPYLSSGMAPS
jgi:serine/threonine protein kinase